MQLSSRFANLISLLIPTIPCVARDVPGITSLLTLLCTPTKKVGGSVLSIQLILFSHLSGLTLTKVSAESKRKKLFFIA
jgi:hypothetical protein